MGVTSAGAEVNVLYEAVLLERAFKIHFIQSATWRARGKGTPTKPFAEAPCDNLPEGHSSEAPCDNLPEGHFSEAPLINYRGSA